MTEAPDSPPTLLNRAQAAAFIGIPLWTLDLLAKRGEIPVRVYGKHHRFDPDQLVAAARRAGERKIRSRERKADQAGRRRSRRRA